MLDKMLSRCQYTEQGRICRKAALIDYEMGWGDVSVLLCGYHFKYVANSPEPVQREIVFDWRR